MFILKRKTDIGKISIKLERDVPLSEMIQICQIASNLTDTVAKQDSSPIVEHFASEEKKLGARPSDTIDYGKYDNEPLNGFTIQMLSYPATLAKVAKELREIVPLPLKSWADILRGNFTKVVFTQETVIKILKVLKDHDIYAKSIPFSKNGAANAAGLAE